LSGGIRPADNDLQSFQSLVPSQDLATDARRLDRGRPSRRHGRGRQHLCEGPPLGGRRPKKAPQDQAIGVSRGGRSTKIHLAADLLGRPIAIHLTAGQHSDIRSVEALLAKIGACKRFIADRAYDADALRQRLRDNGIKPVIPGKQNRIVKIRHDKEAYKQRWRVEAAIGRLKDFRRVATRYDKLARTFRDTVALAAIYMFWL
jgi:transposase